MPASAVREQQEAKAGSCVGLAARRFHHQRYVVRIEITTRAGVNSRDDLAVTPADLPVALARLCTGKPILRNPAAGDQTTSECFFWHLRPKARNATRLL